MKILPIEVVCIWLFCSYLFAIVQIEWKYVYLIFANFLVIELSTCNVRGKEGPKSNDCYDAYNNTEAQNTIRVIEDQMYKGVQVWRVPSENYYT